MSSNLPVPMHETLEWIIWFSELPARVSWQMIKDALKMRVSRGVRNVRHGGPRFISADVGTRENGKRLFDEIVRTGIDGLEDCTFTIAWGYVVRGNKVYSVKFEESTYIPPRTQRHHCHMASMYLSSPMRQSPANSRVHAHAIAVTSSSIPQHTGTIPFSGCLSISGLPMDMTSARAEQLLSRYGDIVTCHVNPPSECRVHFKYAGDAQTAAKVLHEQWSEGCQLFVQFNALSPPQIVQPLRGDEEETGISIDAQDHHQATMQQPPFQTEVSNGANLSMQVMPPCRTESSCSNENSATPLTDAEGRSIVGCCSGTKNRRRKRLADGRSNSVDSGSEDDMSS